jgi:hypothetical protein
MYDNNTADLQHIASYAVEILDIGISVAFFSSSIVPRRDDK